MAIAIQLSAILQVSDPSRYACGAFIVECFLRKLPKQGCQSGAIHTDRPSRVYVSQINHQIVDLIDSMPVNGG
jgi:hypothetical protein|tara:strand:+ start:24566 stop:24784 length:219 start_codon:yes stop_codon:yes gene_type:complete